MRTIKYFYLSILFVLFLSSCNEGRGRIADSLLVESDTTCYAEGFSIKHYKDYSTVEVRNPWKSDSSALLQRYVLVKRDSPIPRNLPKGVVVKIPIKRMVVYMSPQCSVIEKLAGVDDIIAVCEPHYIDSKEIRDRVEDGRIADLGNATSPNIEKIMDLKPEVILATAFENCGYGAAEKTGIPIIEFTDYMEKRPLARTEWVRLFGLLLGKECEADSIFSATKERYDSLKALAATAPEKPTMLAERKYGNSWFLPGGDSYVVSLYKDAGAKYIFDNLNTSNSVPTSVETVLDKARDADYWLLKYNKKGRLSYNELGEENSLYPLFEPFKKRRVYACNTGEEQYYDVILLNPDLILENLIWVFHPELLPNYQPKYFFPLR